MKRLSLKFLSLFVSMLIGSIAFMQFYSPPTVSAQVSSGTWTDITPTSRTGLTANQFQNYGLWDTSMGLHTPFAEIVERRPDGTRVLHWFLGVPRRWQNANVNQMAAILHSNDLGRNWTNITPPTLFGTQMEFQVVEHNWQSEDLSLWNGKVFLYATQEPAPFTIGGTTTTFNYYRPELYRYDGDGESDHTWNSLISHTEGSFGGGSQHTLGSSHFCHQGWHGVGYKAHLEFFNDELYLISWKNITDGNPASWDLIVHHFPGSINQLFNTPSIAFTEKWVGPTYSNTARRAPASIFYFEEHLDYLFIGTSRMTSATPSGYRSVSDEFSLFFQSDLDGGNFESHFDIGAGNLGRPTSGLTPPSNSPTYTFTIVIDGTTYTANTDASTQFWYGAWNYSWLFVNGAMASTYWNFWFLNRNCEIEYTVTGPNTVYISYINGNPPPVGTIIPYTIQGFKGYLYGGFGYFNSVPPASIWTVGSPIRRTAHVTDNMGNPNVFVNQNTQVPNLDSRFGNWENVSPVADPDPDVTRSLSARPTITSMMRTKEHVGGGVFEDDRLYFTHSSGDWNSNQGWAGLWYTEGDPYSGPAPVVGRPTSVLDPPSNSPTYTFDIVIDGTTYTANTDASTEFWYGAWNYSWLFVNGAWASTYWNFWFLNRNCSVEYTDEGNNTIYISYINGNPPAPDPNANPLDYFLVDDEWHYRSLVAGESPLFHYQGTGTEFNIYAGYKILESRTGLMYFFTTPAAKSAPEAHNWRRFRILNAQPDLQIEGDPVPLVIERGQSADITFTLTPSGGFGEDGIRMQLFFPGSTGLFLPANDPMGNPYTENEFFSQSEDIPGPLYQYRSYPPEDYVSPTIRATQSQPLGSHDAVLLAVDAGGFFRARYEFTIQVVPPQPGFSVSVLPSTRQFHAGESVCFNVNIETRFGFEDNVIMGLFWTEEPPQNDSEFEWSDSTYLFDRLDENIVEVVTRRDMGTQYQFCLHTEKTISPGNYQFMILFFSSVDTRTAMVNVRILPPQPTFTITSMPLTGKTVPGGVVRYHIEVESVDNYVGPVTLFIENLPSTVELVSLSPSTVNLSLGQPVAHAELVLQTFSATYAPHRPTNFFARVINRSVINLSWESSRRGTHEIAGYEIWRGPNQHIERANRIATVGPNEVTYDDAQGIESGRSYYYFLRAFDNQDPPNYSDFAPSNEARVMRTGNMDQARPQSVVGTGTLPGYYTFLVSGQGLGYDDFGQQFPITVAANTNLMVYRAVDDMKTPGFDLWGIMLLLAGLMGFVFLQQKKKRWETN